MIELKYIIQFHGAACWNSRQLPTACGIFYSTPGSGPDVSANDLTAAVHWGLTLRLALQGFRVTNTSMEEHDKNDLRGPAARKVRLSSLIPCDLVAG